MLSGMSIYGAKFADENFKLKHEIPGARARACVCVCVCVCPANALLIGNTHPVPL